MVIWPMPDLGSKRKVLKFLFLLNPKPLKPWSSVREMGTWKRRQVSLLQFSLTGEQTFGLFPLPAECRGVGSQTPALALYPFVPIL